MNRTLSASLCLLTLATFAFSQTDDGPWLPAAEHKKVLEMMPKGVPIGKNLKFYKLQAVYQNMYTMNNGRSRHNDITPITDVDPYRVSGGMHHIDEKEWRNVTGLELPSNTKIEYWQEDTDVRAFSLVPKWRWQFPKGTLAYDVLIRIKDGKEHVFEVRIQEKRDEDWDEGTVYRPKVDTKGSERHSWSWDFAEEGFQAQAAAYMVKKIDAKSVFIPSKGLTIDEDRDFTPTKYVGAGMSCNACHARVGQLYDVPGRIYREARRGDDGRFSWHPFSDSGGIDERWPIKAR